MRLSAASKRANAAVNAANDAGEFDLLLSNGAKDRDGESLAPQSWAQPLPDSIPINANHSPSVSDIVGSGRPWIDAEGNLRVTGRFANTEAAQHIRALVADGHLTAVSVEFVRRPDGLNELVGGAFVNVPANPEARVLTAKSLAEFRQELDAALSRFGVKAVGGDAALVQAIHDAACHLGAVCSEPDTDDDEVAKAAALRLRLKAISG